MRFLRTFLVLAALYWIALGALYVGTQVDRNNQRPHDAVSTGTVVKWAPLAARLGLFWCDVWGGLLHTEPLADRYKSLDPNLSGVNTGVARDNLWQSTWGDFLVILTIGLNFMILLIPLVLLVTFIRGFGGGEGVGDGGWSFGWPHFAALLLVAVIGFWLVHAITDGFIDKYLTRRSQTAELSAQLRQQADAVYYRWDPNSIPACQQVGGIDHLLPSGDPHNYNANSAPVAPETVMWLRTNCIVYSVEQLRQQAVGGFTTEDTYAKVRTILAYNLFIAQNGIPAIGLAPQSSAQIDPLLKAQDIMDELDNGGRLGGARAAGRVLYNLMVTYTAPRLQKLLDPAKANVAIDLAVIHAMLAASPDPADQDVASLIADQDAGILQVNCTTYYQLVEQAQQEAADSSKSAAAITVDPALKALDCADKFKRQLARQTGAQLPTTAPTAPAVVVSTPAPSTPVSLDSAGNGTSSPAAVESLPIEKFVGQMAAASKATPPSASVGTPASTSTPRSTATPLPPTPTLPVCVPAKPALGETYRDPCAVVQGSVSRGRFEFSLGFSGFIGWLKSLPLLAKWFVPPAVCLGVCGLMAIFTTGNDGKWILLGIIATIAAWAVIFS